MSEGEARKRARKRLRAYRRMLEHLERARALLFNLESMPLKLDEPTQFHIDCSIKMVELASSKEVVARAA